MFDAIHLVALGGRNIAAAGISAALTGTVVARIWGLSAAPRYVAIAVTAGGVGVLNKLRDYEIETHDSRTFLEK